MFWPWLESADVDLASSWGLKVYGLKEHRHSCSNKRCY